MTFTECLYRSIGKGLFIFALCVIYMLTVWFTPTVAGTDEQMMDIRDHAEGSVAQVIETYACDTQLDHSTGAFPSGVIYQTKDGRAHYSESDVKIGKALDYAINGKAWPAVSRINTFCE